MGSLILIRAPRLKNIQFGDFRPWSQNWNGYYSGMVQWLYRSCFDMGMLKSPFRNGDPHFDLGIQTHTYPHFKTGITISKWEFFDTCFDMEIPILKQVDVYVWISISKWGNQYWNGGSIDTSFDMGICISKWVYVYVWIPISKFKMGIPYWNGDSSIPSPSVWTCKRFHLGAAVGMLVVVLMLPLSLQMDNGEFDNGYGGGGSGGLAAAAGEVVTRAFDGGGSVAAFNGGNGLRRCNGKWDMTFKCGSDGWQRRLTAVFDGDNEQRQWRRQQLAKMPVQQRRWRQCDKGIEVGATEWTQQATTSHHNKRTRERTGGVGRKATRNETIWRPRGYSLWWATFHLEAALQSGILGKTYRVILRGCGGGGGCRSDAMRDN